MSQIGTITINKNESLHDGHVAKRCHAAFTNR